MSAELLPPRLLVSVRNPAEARIAGEADVDLIDLKEPFRGSLGMVQMTVAEQVAELLPATTLSLALGELQDWDLSCEMPKIPGAFRYLKLGLSFQQGIPWRDNWLRLRESINRRANQEFDWIAVIYADALAARSPAPAEIIQMAADTGCAGVLFDTWSKRAGSLTDHLTVAQLRSHLEKIHSAGLLAAFAGSLRAEHLPELLPLKPDVIAVRGAVCRGTDRTQDVQADLIREFQARLRTGGGYQLDRSSINHEA